MTPVADWLRDLVPVRDAYAFPDGAPARIEIPSVEGPDQLDGVLAAADEFEVPVTRVSQGSGVGMLSDAELEHMSGVARDRGIELCLFARPSAAWSPSAAGRGPAGAAYGPTTVGMSGLTAAVEGIARAAEHGVRSVLISDLGLLSTFARLRDDGRLPATMVAKVSVMLAVANPATATVLASLGAGTLNVPPDIATRDLADLRAATDLPLDMYVESPDEVGGFVRHHELQGFIDAAAPLYAKFGLRNAPPTYPSGTHLLPMELATGRERVRRARLAIDAQRLDDALFSRPRAKGLAVPEVPA